jgi:hypothetical protein
MEYILGIIAFIFFVLWIYEGEMRSQLIGKSNDIELDNINLEHKLFKIENLLAQKKELLEIQDKLLNENNIKH